MINKTKTITIGIPAYNEGANIKKLLNKLLQQKLDCGVAVIREVFVVSDGSTDNTVETARSLSHPILKVVARKERLGVNHTLNQIIDLATGDILVILNADVLPKSNSFLQKLIMPIIEDKNVGLVGGNVVGANPKKIFERIIKNSHDLKINLGKAIKQSNNVYMCYGGNRAFSKEFYSQLNFPNGYPEDSFSYFYCIHKGFKFVFQENAKVEIRLPNTFRDHTKQSTRFSAGKRKLKAFFGKSVIDAGFYIPRKIYIKTVLRFLIKDPFSTVVYLLIAFLLRNISKNVKFNTKWEIVKSTKTLS